MAHVAQRQTNATGVPNGYVEHVREITVQSIRVRAAYKSGDLKKRTRRRSQLTKAQAQAQADAIKAALGL